MSDSDFLAQTPNSSGLWGDVQFTLDEIEDPDYLIVLNRPKKDITVRCRPSCVWGVIQEPPNEIFRPMHKGQRAFGRILMADERNVSSRHILSHPGIPYFVGKSFDDLKCMPIPEKPKSVCCIMSATRLFKGHLDRLAFLKSLRERVNIDLFGYGIKSIPSKWDTLAQYKYAVVLENYLHPWYWSEKVSDCFLSWTMPLYLGCPRISEYFPVNSFIELDKSPEIAADQISAAIAHDVWEQNFESLNEARQRTLYEYGCFAYLANQILKFELVRDTREPVTTITVRTVTSSILETWVRSTARSWRLDLPSWVSRKAKAIRKPTKRLVPKGSVSIREIDSSKKYGYFE
jgi:hypothetical protein